MTILPQCMDCRRLADDDLKCKAFPDGIPDDILMNRFDHRKPYPDDHDVRFEPLPGRKSVFEGQPDGDEPA